ncbi:MAG: abortive infection system antitoxin AbiGi family protein [Candidatus Scalindua sp.]
MKNPTDNGYISNYLTHWTGKKNSCEGTEILSIISSSCQLLLSYNQIHIFDYTFELHDKMVCFTDVPFSHSTDHCIRYGQFGIAFHKAKLIGVGAQPVHYTTHNNKSDLDRIFSFIKDQTENLTIEKALLRAFHRHFYFTKRYSERKAGGTGEFYYEREWRLGEQSLVLPEKLDRPNAKFHCRQEGFPPYIGEMVKKGDKSYFKFNPEDVAFIIVPKKSKSNIDNPHRFAILDYEDLAQPLAK